MESVKGYRIKCFKSKDDFEIYEVMEINKYLVNTTAKERIKTVMEMIKKMFGYDSKKSYNDYSISFS